MVLSDGSTIDINSGSRVVYPRVFAPDQREIYVEGEVCLHVAKNEKAPFIVKTESFDVKVLGTTFNVNAYKDAPRSEVVLVEGSVCLSDRQNHSVVMEPDRLVAVEDGEMQKPQMVNVNKYIAWTDGLMILSEESLEMVLKRLARFYGVRVNISPEVVHLEMRGKIDLTLSFDELMELIKSTAPVTCVKNKDGSYSISCKNNMNNYKYVE